MVAMAAVAAANAPVSATAAPVSHRVNEYLEYEKILKLRDSVFAGSHPRLTVPTNVIRKVSPRVAQAPTQHPPSIPPNAVTPSVTLPGLQLNNPTDSNAPNVPLPNGIPPALRSEPPAASASGIDPIFLTKADVVLSAEIKLHRQRLERKLRDQLEKKRNDARHKTPLQEAKPDFDVSDVLEKALEIAKPVTFEDQRGDNDNVSASDSFDENSFYSSKAPDSTPRDRAPSPFSKHQAQPMNVDDLDADEDIDQRPDEMRQLNLDDSPYKINPRPPLHGISYSHPSHHPDDSRLPVPNEVPDLTVMPLDEDEDEGEYSPPEPIEQYPPRATGYSSAKRPFEEQNRRINGRSSGQYQGGRRYDSPAESDMRIVRNHITSPVAPQPSRVSPLAVSKAPPTSQNRRPQQAHSQQRRMGEHESLRTSPDVPAPSIQPNKRRKLNGKKAQRKRGAVSPDVTIKDEPVSPPPFHEAQPLGATKTRPAKERPVYIDLDPPREVRYVAAPGPQSETLHRQVVYDMEPPMPRSEPRPYSRSGPRALPRDDEDLRRVASLQHLRAVPPREEADMIFQTPTRASRAPSRAPAEVGIRPGPLRTYQEPVYAYEQPVIDEDRVQTSPVYREIDIDRRYEPQPQQMPPPHRRIVVDQNGDQFYEIVQPSKSSVVPQPARPIEVEPYNEAVSVRNRSVRAVSMIRDPYQEERYVQEMPPPQISYRRVTEASRKPVIESRQMLESQLDSRQIQRSASVQLVDYAPRQSAYRDAQVAPRDTLRMSSVRPTMTRYEEAPEMVQRVQGVRPEGREMSVYVDDRPQVRTEYVPVERTTHGLRRVVQDSRYYEIDDGGRMILDGAADGRQYVARY
jgi:hypothetical protein